MKKPARDVNQAAARVVAKTTGKADALPSDVEGAWRVWSCRIQNVDARTLTLLRAAFDAGVEAGARAATRC